MKKKLCALAILCLFLSGPVAGAQQLVDGGVAVVARVVDGDTVVLDDGREVRMTGIQAPKLPLGRPNFAAWPLADEAKRTLEALSLGRGVRLGYGGARMDRHGRVLAHLHRDDGTWLQGEMVAMGLARVYTFADNRALADELYRLEGAARSKSLGIWGDPFYRVRTPNDAASVIGSFQVVEGTVLDAALVKGTVYLNFGPDWRTDFTVTIEGGPRRLFERAGIDLPALKGKRIRVRGWLTSRNGPMITASHPEQIETLDD